MIEPIRGIIGAFDVSCSSCGIVERFEDLRFGHIIIRMSYAQVLTRMKAKGWGYSENRKHLCPECELERTAPSAPLATTHLSASVPELEELFGIEIVEIL